MENLDEKYELTNKTKKVRVGWGKYVIVHKIRAIKDFGNVKAGDFGGWVEKKNNLSHKGDCWIYDDAVACQNAIVYENAKLMNKAMAFGQAVVKGNSEGRIFAKIYGNAILQDNAWVSDNAQQTGSKIGNNVILAGSAVIGTLSTIVLSPNEIYYKTDAPKKPLYLRNYGKKNIHIIPEEIEKFLANKVNYQSVINAKYRKIYSQTNKPFKTMSIDQEITK